MKELLEMGLKPYDPAGIEVSKDFDCPHCYAPASTQMTLKRIVGWSQAAAGHYGVFECQGCFELYRHHIYHLDETPAGFIKAARRWVRRWEDREAGR